MKIRIGIDVGGTFTDAVAINDDTYELIGAVKLPTTHTAPEGVAAGIVAVLNKIMSECSIRAEDVVFIAHGTTQATNALLEGDVSKVGILTLGSGVEGAKSKSDTNIGDIELAKGKFLHTVSSFANTGGNGELDESIRRGIEALRSQDAEVIVASEAFSVDNPERENKALAVSASMGLPATAGHEVSKLYGLKVRTRTAVVNASILPKMLDAANMTESSIMNANITAPLMIMRCDGGVMTVSEVRSRPILTILSGPAAGVAGALMYEKLTDGIFLEVGGTSTDISCVKDGVVMIKYAEIGGHKTYLNSLDVRTVGIGGGSMIEMDASRIVNVGPRSAHIAGLPYEVYADPAEIVDPILKVVRPRDGDPDYAYIECANGRRYALTLSGAANIAGYVKDVDYARGNVETAKKAWQPLAAAMGLTILETAAMVLKLSSLKNGKVVERLINDYGLSKDTIVFVGGGGGASTVVPHLAESFGCTCRLAKNAEVISPIGVSLAMVRDMVERTVSNPTEADILSLRREAVRMAVKSGANPDTVEVRIEVDIQKQKVRAIAIGSTELRTKSLGSAAKSEDELKRIVAENLKTVPEKVSVLADNGSLCAMTTPMVKKVFGIFKKQVNPVRIIDRDGVIRLQKRNATVRACQPQQWRSVLKNLLDECTNFSDGGEEVPNMYLALGSKIIDMSGMQSRSQIMAVCEVELAGIQEDEQMIAVCTLTTENGRG